ncbi:MAG: hypothetical protein WEB58_05315 [Planctomycetaceae bacterium]
MTPQLIKARLLSARQDEIKAIATELRDDPPANLAELVETLNAERAAIQRGILAIQRERQEAGTLSGRPAGSFHEIDD